MTSSPDELTRCRCGSSTYLVPNTDSLRTCSRCGYLTSFCRCKRQGPISVFSRAKFPSVTDRTRAIVGSAVLSSIGTLFVVTLFSSPFLAVFGLGIPLGLNVSFFARWLRDQRPAVVGEGVAEAPRLRDIGARRA